MFQRYLEMALARAQYEIIEDEEPFYGDVPGLQGVWATGLTLAQCRDNLARAIEDWMLFSIANRYPIPSLDGVSIEVPERMAA